MSMLRLRLDTDGEAVAAATAEAQKKWDGGCATKRAGLPSPVVGSAVRGVTHSRQEIYENIGANLCNLAHSGG